MTGSWNGMRQLSSRTGPLLTSMLVFLATMGVARAQELCANLGTLIEHSRSQFADIADKPSGDTGDHDVALVLSGASTCSVAKALKGSSYHCRWKFPYRARQAYDTFDGFVRGVNDCIGRQATVHGDQSVNHPDYYALRRYETEQAVVSVSVKDKGALGSTFVFIRVQGRTGN